MFLPIVLSLLNRVGREVDCVLDSIFQILIFHLSDPVLKTLFHKIKHVFTQMSHSGFQQVFTMFLEINNFFPF